MPTSIGPIIKVDGEKEYRQSMKNIIASTKELDSELKATATSFDKSGKAQNTNAQKVENLKKKIVLQKKAIKEANEMCDKAKQKYGEDSEEAKKYETQVNNLTAELNQMNNELKAAGGSTLGAKLKDVGEGMKSISEKGMAVGSALTKGVTGPILGIGAAAYKAWQGVDEGMDTVALKTGKTGKELEGLQKSLENVYKNSSLDMDVLAGALGEINTRFGFTGKELEKNTDLFSKFATITDSDVVDAVDSADKVMKQFGVSSDKADGYLGLLTATSQRTGMSAGDLQKSLEKNGSTLRAMGLDVGQSITLMGNLSQAGFDDETAIKAMSKAAQNYSKDGTDAAEGMRNLIKGVQDGTISFDELSKVVGTKNAVAFQELAKSGALSLDDLETNLDDYAGTVDQTFDDTQDPIDEMKKVFHQLQLAGASLFTTIGKVATPIIQKLSTYVSKFSKWWDKLNPKTKEMIVKVAAIAAAIGPVILMISKVIGVVSLLANPIGLVVAAIAGITAAIVTLWNKNEAFRDFVTKLWNGLKNTAIAIWDTITGLFTGKITVGEVLHKAWDGLKNIASNIWNAIKNFFTQTINLKEIATTAWENAKKAASNAWNAIKGFFESAAPVVKEIAVSAWNKAKTFASNVWQKIKNIWEGAPPVVKEIATKAWDTAKKAASTAWTAIKGFFESAAPVVKKIATTAWDNAKSAAESAWKSIKGFFEGAAPVVKNIAVSAWTRAKQAASHAWEDIKGFFEGAAPVVKKIATTAWDNAKTAAETAWTNIKGFFEGAAPVVKEIATTAWDNAQKVAGDCWNAITGFFEGDFPFPDIAGIAEKAFKAVKDAASSAWNWICGLFGGDEEEELKTGEVDTSSISGATVEMEKAFKEVNLEISDVDVSSITEANQFVNNSILSYSKMFKNLKLAFPAIDTKSMNLAKIAVTTAQTLIKKSFDLMKLNLPTINVNALTNMKTAVNSAVSTVKTSINTMKLILPFINVTSLTTAKSAVDNAVGGIKGSFSNMRLSLPSIGTSALSSLKNDVDNALASIKSKAAGFSWKIPAPKYATIAAKFTEKKSKDGKVTGYDLDYNVTWHDKGGIFYDPAIIGVAEKRPEFVGALDDLKDVVKAAMAEAGSRPQTTFIQNNTSPKALSRLEIYRQTRNVLSLARG